MRCLIIGHTVIVAALACASACAPKDGEPGETDASSGSSTGTDGEEPTGGSSDTEEPTAGEASTCEGEPTDAAEFEFTFDWVQEEAEIDVTCEVDAVTVDAGQVTTAFTCDLGGASGAASLRFAAPPEGPVDWEAGLAVRVKWLEELEFGDLRLVQLRAAEDDGLLAVGVYGGQEGPDVQEAFAPLTYGHSSVCGAPSGDVVPAQLDFEASWGEALHLMQGQRGSLPIDAGHAFAIDVGRAEDNASAHFGLWQNVVLRRVRLGG
ncbi:hypothetical protein [Nannocystis punicea]|uniref:Lipoprotein n=1 Tax=Nannocystis punicea TaxID=2995304 RepID=A0ABY7HC85_9BACT|nr:hypothetical protein [Nannocystis poenicansa]WAS96811.1 hypothetical protein O0S08_11745 [Nannocystis poenicansa]